MMSISRDEYDIVVVGAGFFGMNVAEYFAKHGKHVLLCERSGSTMGRASYVNQARVHNGYHYPRSILTAMRSHMSFPRFVEDFKSCIYSDFDQYYAVARILSKVNAKQYREFCRRVGDVCDDAPQRIVRLFNERYIEAVFKTREYAFDAIELNSIMTSRIKNANVELVLNADAKHLKKNENCFAIEVSVDGEECIVNAKQVFNCTYGNLNALNYNSGLDLIPLKYEMTEMALVDVPEEINGNGFTVMCGPFFSIMPFPAENTYSLSHVRYTPHYEWYDNKEKYANPLDVCDADRRQTSYVEMVHDAARYLPCMSQCRYKKSIWDIKTVLPSSEVDDSRPILFKIDCNGLAGYHCIMGGKIDNIYDVFQVIEDNNERFML